MITFALSALLAAVTIATVLTLIDNFVRGRLVFEALREERALLDAGFVPMATASETRVRQPVRFDALATPTRLPSQRLAAQRPHSRPRSQRSAPGAA